MDSSRRGTGRDARRRALAASAAAIAAVALLAIGCETAQRSRENPGPVRPPGSAPPEADTRQTDVLLVTRTPTSTRRNLVWCATIQLAWDELVRANRTVWGEKTAADRLGLSNPFDKGMRLGPPAPSEIVAELNHGPFPASDLDETSYVVEAGQVKSGVFEKFQTRLAKMPGASFPLSLPSLDPEDVAALCYLRKDLPFRQPFHVHEEPLAFAGGPSRIVTFGMDPDAEGGEASSMARQAVHHEDGDAFAVELLPKAGTDRIVLASIPRPTTLEDGWLATGKLLQRPGEPLFAGAELRIPKIDFATTRTFTELIGAPLLDYPPPAQIKDARQRNEFTLSEQGARLVSAAVVANSCSAPAPRRRLRLVFDRPFLLAMIQNGATRPYFLCWFENDDLFVKSQRH